MEPPHEGDERRSGAARVNAENGKKNRKKSEPYTQTMPPATMSAGLHPALLDQSMLPSSASSTSPAAQ